MNFKIEFQEKSYDFDISKKQSYQIVSQLGGFEDDLIHEISNDGSNIKIRLLTSGIGTHCCLYPIGKVCPTCKGAGRIDMY